MKSVFPDSFILSIEIFKQFLYYSDKLQGRNLFLSWLIR